MTILHPTSIQGRVEALLVNPDRNDESIATAPVERVKVSFEGFLGERHAGLTSLSDVRYRRQYARNTPIRNTRQITILSAEELAEIADTMEIGEVRADWLGGNLVLSGIPDLTLLSPSTRLIFSSGAALVVDNENEPCRYPADIVEQHYPGSGRQFVAAARHKRGLVSWVEKEGAIAIGDTVNVHLPPQRLYPHS